MSGNEDIALKNRIHELFEQYEDSSADEGWLLLRERFPQKKKKSGIIWWWAAAGLLLFSGLFLFLRRDDETLTRVSIKRASTENIASSKSPVIDDLSAKIARDNKGRLSKPSTVNNSTQNLNIQKPGYTHQSLFKKSEAGSVTNDKKALTIAQEKIFEETQPKTTENIAADEKLTADKLKKDTANLQNIKTLIAATAREDQILKDKQTDPVLKMMADDKAKENHKIAVQQPAKKTSMVELSPYAATYFNYAKGSSSQVNVGAGITTDFKLNDNIKFSTGVAIAQNTLSFDNANIPSQVANSAAAYYSVSATATGASGSTSFLALNNYKANLIGLDIPLNFKYQFDPAKNDTYISAGISSGTFVNESYSSTVQYNNFFTGTTTNTTLVNSNSQHFSTFDFARTVNFSFGVGYPVGGNRLIVEPFLKYPIGGLGSQNLRFGASGINFKFNFSTSKK